MSERRDERHDDKGALDLRSITEAAAWDRVAEGYAGVISGHLVAYAEDALRLAEVSAEDTVVDVATGPGTLALVASDVAAKVSALDFSAEMLEALRRRATPTQLERLELRQGDGQALPYDDASFDAAFSMFGLFMFPDRAKGFAELARVLGAGGRAVVASWQPQDQIPAFTTVIEELMREAGATPEGGQPLAQADDLREEMGAAGFEVEVHGATHTWRAPAFDVLWEGLQRSHVGLGIARVQLPAPRFAALLARIETRLRETQGEGPQEITMPAWLALGRRS